MPCKGYRKRSTAALDVLEDPPAKEEFVHVLSQGLGVDGVLEERTVNKQITEAKGNRKHRVAAGVEVVITNIRYQQDGRRTRNDRIADLVVALSVAQHDVKINSYINTDFYACAKPRSGESEQGYVDNHNHHDQHRSEYITTACGYITRSIHLSAGTPGHME